MGSTYLGKPIGLQNVTWFPLTADSSSGTTYGAAVKLGRAMRATVTPQLATALLESDDGVEEDLNLVTGYDISLDVSQVNDATRAAMFGHQVDSHGGLVVAHSDQPVQGALAFRTLLSTAGGAGEKYAYHILYKGRLKEFAENFETLKRGNVTFQTHTGIEGSFYKRDSDGYIRYTMREDSTGFNKAKAEAWFTSVQEPTFPAGGG